MIAKNIERNIIEFFYSPEKLIKYGVRTKILSLVNLIDWTFTLLNLAALRIPLSDLVNT